MFLHIKIRSYEIGLRFRDGEFQVVPAAAVTARVVLPDGEERELRVAASDPQSGRYAGEFRFDQPGVYRINASAQ